MLAFQFSYFYFPFLSCILLFMNTASSESSSVINRSCPNTLTTLHVSGSSFIPYLSFKNNISSNTTQTEGELVRCIEESAKHCCSFINTSYTKLEINSSDDIEVAIRKHQKNKAMLYFPVFANRDEKKQFGRDFIPLFESPGIAFLEIEGGEISGLDFQTWESLMSAWTTVIELVLAATIAGMIIWFLDSRRNEDFSDGFFAGSADGIWWSFVTMTTVGYGDKSPKSVIGRVFGIIWMIAGTIFLSAFSARITAQLAIFNMGSENNFVDTLVAVPLGMQNFLENEFNLGAKYIEIDNELILNRIANRSAVSPKIPENVKYAIVHDQDYLKMDFLKKKKKTIEPRIKKTIEHRLSLGMVITEKMDNMKHFHECWYKEMVDKIAIHKAEMRSFYRDALKLTQSPQAEGWNAYGPVICLLGANGILFLFGCLWETYKKIKKKLTARTVT